MQPRPWEFTLEAEVENDRVFDSDILRKDIPHPVIASEDGWIKNHLDQNILWIHPRAFAEKGFSNSWRWCQKKLIIAGDSDVSSLFVLDFAGVDVAIPCPSDSYKMLGYTTMTISGLDQHLFDFD